MGPRFLFLHGFGESNLLAGNSTSTLLEVLKPEGITLDSPDGWTQLKDDKDFAPIPDEDYKALCKDGSIESYCWYKLAKKEAKFNHAVGGKRGGGAADFAYQPESMDALKNGVDSLIAHIDKLGGVDGIVGFSQGGELAYSLMESLSKLNSVSLSKLKFIATFGSEDTFKNIGRKMPKLSNKIHFYLCYGDGDADAVQDAPSTMKALTEAGAKNTTIKKIAGHGHGMPTDKAVYKEMLECFKKAQKGENLPEAKKEPEYTPEKVEFYVVMTDPEGRCSTGKSSGAPVEPGSKYNAQWTIIASDFTEEDAKLYIRMNWKDMTPKSVADGHRSWAHPKYKHYTDAEYTDLWHRDTKKEFIKKAPAAREKERIAEEEEKAKAAEKRALKEAEEAKGEGKKEE